MVLAPVVAANRIHLKKRLPSHGRNAFRFLPPKCHHCFVLLPFVPLTSHSSFVLATPLLYPAAGDVVRTKIKFCSSRGLAL